MYRRWNKGGILLAGYDQSGAPSNWNQWLSELQNQIWKAQHNEIVKPFYGTNKPLFPGGQPLPVGMNWKQWWSTHNVCVSVVLRCFGTKHSSRSGLLYGSLGLWKSTCKVWQQPQPDQIHRIMPRTTISGFSSKTRFYLRCFRTTISFRPGPKIRAGNHVLRATCST